MSNGCRPVYRALFLASALMTVAATSFAEVNARLLAGESIREVVVLSVDRNQLTYRPKDVARGVSANMRLDEIRETRFDIEIDEGAVFDAARERDWERAAALILRAAAPTLPFLALPENDTVRPLFRAGNYLLRAGRQMEELGDEEDTEAIRRRYEQALSIFDQVAKAEWLFEGELAALRAIECLIHLDRPLDAEARLRRVRVPVVDDGAYGLYQLVTARLHVAYSEWRDAIDALTHVVVFDNKNAGIFADALLLYGICHEEMFQVHRARDIYYEVARLFARTEWGEQAFDRLAFLMDNDLTAQDEPPRITRVFFGIEEDMNEKAQDLLNEYRSMKDDPDPSSGDS